ncbi:AraC family transcriptional regulator [Mycobacterium sp. SMC-13]|uniref:AraC family transcriptional regulator n=1 Tax=Mycobacterium sp. SMC-13 TaxID=3381626 RepID=UPI00387719EB
MVIRGHTMNKIGHSSILNVRYSTSRLSIEVMSLSELRLRARPMTDQFLRPQRVDFDLLVVCDAGTFRHTVDFVEYVLSPGDVLWVRAGQVQEWQSSAVIASHTLKAIDYADVAATIVLFQPTRLDERARALSGSVQPRSLWSRAAVHASPARRRLDDLIETAARSLPPSMQEELLARMLGMLVVELALADPVENAAHGTSEDLFSALTAAIDANFASTRNTGDYARQLGYSARTINRSALRNTGLTVKQLVDQRALLEAKRLLVHDTASVQAVGRAVGFPEPTTFTRFFRHRAGVTPLEFRAAQMTPRSVAQ